MERLRYISNCVRYLAVLWVLLSLMASYASANSLEQPEETSILPPKAPTSSKPFPPSETSKASEAAETATSKHATTMATVSPTASPASPGNTIMPASPGNSSMPTNSTAASNCHRTTEDGAAEPFCEPQMWQEVLPEKEYNVTWDPLFFNHSVNVTVEVKYADNFGDGDIVRWNDTVPNEQGRVMIPMNPQWLTGVTCRNLTLLLVTEFPGGMKNETAGPTISLVESLTPPSSPSPTPSPSASLEPAIPAPHKSSDKVGLGVGIPLGLIFLAGLAGVLFFMRRRRRGYSGTRIRGRGAVQLTGDEFRTTRSRGNSFKDEPVQGVELQPRNGHQRQYSIGESSISPISDTGRESSNAFRDEIARQRAGDHRPR